MDGDYLACWMEGTGERQLACDAKAHLDMERHQSVRYTAGSLAVPAAQWYYIWTVKSYQVIQSEPIRRGATATHMSSPLITQETVLCLDPPSQNAPYLP